MAASLPSLLVCLFSVHHSSPTVYFLAILMGAGANTMQRQLKHSVSDLLYLLPLHYVIFLSFFGGKYLEARVKELLTGN
jgi:hypothetical protein